jgi:hypothetical protein
VALSNVEISMGFPSSSRNTSVEKSIDHVQISNASQVFSSQALLICTGASAPSMSSCCTSHFSSSIPSPGREGLGSAHSSS